MKQKELNMSADNYIYIDQKTFEVWSCTASCVAGRWDKNNKQFVMTGDDLQKQKDFLIGKGKDLDDAMKIASMYESDIEREGHYVEYGISTKLWCK